MQLFLFSGVSDGPHYLGLGSLTGERMHAMIHTQRYSLYTASVYSGLGHKYLNTDNKYCLWSMFDSKSAYAIQYSVSHS